MDNQLNEYELAFWTSDNPMEFASWMACDSARVMCEVYVPTDAVDWRTLLFHDISAIVWC